MRRQKVPVAVDGRLAAAEATGVASYAAAMRAALSATGPAPLVIDDARRGQFGGRAPVAEMAWRRVRARLPRPVELQLDGGRLHARDVFRLAQARFEATGRLLDLIAPGPPGIVHWTYPLPLRLKGWVNLYTVHDVIPLTAPGFSPSAPEGLARRIMAVAEVADRIVTVSEAAREEITRVLPLGPAQVVNCGGAVMGLEPGQAALPAGLRAGEYFLFCGLAEPRKNLPRLIAAWAASGTARPLVLTGPDFGSVEPREGLVILPYQPRDVLAALLRDARAVLFPSLAEGFGLPVAEAMMLGTPVLTSNRAALAETAGGAAIVIDPEDVPAMAQAIARLDQDAALRAELSTLGRVRAAAFSPSAFGMRLRALHDEFAGDSRLAP